MLNLWGILHPLIISLTVIPLPIYEHKKKIGISESLAHDFYMGKKQVVAQCILFFP